MGVEVRKVDDHVYDGTTGAEVDTVTRYELGAEIDGAWVRFTSLAGDHVDALVERHKAAQAKKDETASQPTGDLGAVSQAPNAAPHEDQTGSGAQ